MRSVNLSCLSVGRRCDPCNGPGGPWIWKSLLEQPTTKKEGKIETLMQTVVSVRRVYWPITRTPWLIISKDEWNGYRSDPDEVSIDG